MLAVKKHSPAEVYENWFVTVIKFKVKTIAELIGGSCNLERLEKRDQEMSVLLMQLARIRLNVFFTVYR